MTTYSFSLILDRKPSDDELDALFEAGLDDSTPATVSGNGWLHVDREASSMLKAVTSAIRDMHTAGLAVSAVHSGDLVSLKEVASRVNRSYEAVRLWSLGRRGPGGFPRLSPRLRGGRCGRGRRCRTGSTLVVSRRWKSARTS